MTDAIEARLARLEDILEIHQLFVDYGRYLDAGNFEAYADLFADDAEVLLGPVGRAKGRDEILAVMTKAGGTPGNSIHIISSPAVELDGDRATSEVRWTLLQRGSDGRPTVSMIGRHVDELVRERGRWRFRRRKGYIDIPSVMRAPKPTG